MLIRLLALLGLLWTGKQVAHQISAILHGHQKIDNKTTEREIRGEMVKDPVCQTYIPKSLAIQKKLNGEIYYFCSEACVAKFAEQQDMRQ